MTSRLIEQYVLRIVEMHAATLQEFLDNLITISQPAEPKFASLYSPLVRDTDYLTLVASTADHAPKTIPLRDLRSAGFSLFDVHDSLYLLTSSNLEIPPEPLMFNILSNKIHEVIYHKRQLIRRTVIEQSIKSRDVNSFLYRLVRALAMDIIYAEDFSIFLYDDIAKKLYLSASTSELRGIEKKDVYYGVTQHTPCAEAFRNNSSLIEDTTSGFKREDFDGNLFSATLFNRGFWPISLVSSSFQSLEATEISPLGVIRLSNLRRRRNSRTWSGQFCQYDQIIMSFISEVVFVLVQQYFQSMTATTDFARLTHGLGANIDASIKFVGNLRDELFDVASPDGVLRAKFTLTHPDLPKITEIFLTMKNLEYFLEDLSYQFARYDATNLASYQLETIEKPYSDVLMPAVRLTDAIAAVNSKNPPKIANLKMRGAQDLPPILGNRKGFIMVLRNLFENSIKYTKDKVAKITIDVRDDSENIYLDYYDQGIGISDKEMEQIFVEGWRSAAARRINNRGIGVGLSSSREVMRGLRGDLKCVKHSGGAHFELRMRKAR